MIMLTGASCANPGDPIGGYQWPRTNKTSFLLGEGVTFRCNDPEDELGGQSIAMECAIIDGKAQYDSSLPLCLREYLIVSILYLCLYHCQKHIVSFRK